MTSTYERTIDDLREDLRNAKDRDGATVLIGAGASKSAGVPLATEICTIISEKFPQAKRRAERDGDAGYQDLMGELSAADRRELLGKLIDDARINWAHIALAGLIRDGYVTRVLTPNFDSLVIQACALLNVFPAIYDLATTDTFDASNVSSPAVFYLHGQRTGFRQLNRDHVLKKHVKTLGPVIEEAAGSRPWIVLGYSGESDPVFDELLAKRTFDGNLYWVTYKNHDPAAHLANGFLSRDDARFFVRGYDADSFFLHLAARLDCFPPKLVDDPFGHLMETYEQIVADHPPDEENRTGKLLAQARETVRRAAEVGAEAFDAATQEADDLTDLRVALAAGEYDRVIEAFEAAPSQSVDLRDLAASAYHWQGVELAIAAQQADDEVTARAGFESACRKFAAALKAKPDDPEALYSLALASAKIAELTVDASRSRQLYEEAAVQFGDAVEADRDNEPVLNDWGLVMLRVSGMVDDEGKRQRLLSEAETILQRARALDPDRVYNLACVYAQTDRPDQARDLLFHARDVGTLPDADHLRDDPDLVAVRDEPWFENLLGDG